MCSDVSIYELEVWLRDFNSSTTSNERKKELQIRLHNFQINQNNWKICFQSLSNGCSNQFLWLFNVSTVETAITKYWSNLQTDERVTIRNFLWQMYLSMNSRTPTSKMERCKIAQLIALVGKRELLNHQPGFINEILELLHSNVLLGMTLLKSTSDEVSSTKEDLTTEQKKFFQACFTACLPQIFEVINKFIAIIVCKISKANLVEIPPEFKDLRLIQALPEDETTFLKICNEALECIQHLFGWVPLNQNLSEFLLNSLFLLAKWHPGRNVDIATNALTVISELFYRQIGVPHPILIANGILQLVNDESVVKSSPELYQDKLTELLRLFTTQHSSKWLQDESFPNLLWHFYHFTFNSYGALAFTERLNIWVPIIKGLQQNGFRNYHDILITLMKGILEKMQFKNDQQEWLELLDNSNLGDDLETEWQHFLAQCIEIIALVAEGTPEQTMEVVINTWRVPFEVFFVIEKAIINGDYDLNFLNSDSKAHYIHCILKDLSSLCQTFSRLAPILEHCSNRISELVKTVAISLVLSVKFLATKKPYKIKSLVLNEELQTDMVEMFAQMLYALKGILPWASHLKLESYINSITDLIVQLLIIEHPSKPPLESTEPLLIKVAAAQLLLSITTTIRPKNLLDCHQIKMLMNCGLALHEDSKEVGLLVYKSICNTILLPLPPGGPGANNHQLINARIKHLSDFLLKNISHKFISASNDFILNHRKSPDFCHTTDQTLQVLKEILDYYEEANSITKQMLMSPMKELVEKVLELFKHFSSNPAMSNPIFMFLLSFIQTLQIQLGQAYIKDMITVLLAAILSGTNISERVNQNGNSIEKLLQILCLIVKNSSATTQQVLLPSILELILDHIVPFIGQEAINWIHNTDIICSIYILFDRILLNHWQYFYQSGVLRKIKSDSSLLLNALNDEIQHQDQFLAIMSLYGRALVSGNDPHVMDIVLKSLQSLNEHWKLYHKEIFQTLLLSSFQYALIGAIIAPEGALCYDQLMATLYSMGQANAKLLHESFLTYGFPPDHKLVQQICLTTDLPTFSYQMAQLIQDIRCVQYNGSADKTF